METIPSARRPVSVGAALAPADLFRPCVPATLGFRTTDELPDSPITLGQDRAVSAIQFGIGIRHSGYNLFALGPRTVQGGRRFRVEHRSQRRRGCAVCGDDRDAGQESGAPPIHRRRCGAGRRARRPRRRRCRQTLAWPRRAQRSPQGGESLRRRLGPRRGRCHGRRAGDRRTHLPVGAAAGTPAGGHCARHDCDHD